MTYTSFNLRRNKSLKPIVLNLSRVNFSALNGGGGGGSSNQSSNFQNRLLLRQSFPQQSFPGGAQYSFRSYGMIVVR